MADPKIKLGVSVTGAKQAQSRLKALSGAIRAVGAAAATYIGFQAVTAFVNFVARVEDEEQKFRQIFRSMEEEMIAWGKQFSKQFGRSEVDLHRFVSTMADVLKPMGFTTSEAAAMSKEFTKLGYDLAAFNNRTDASAIHAITVALTGEREMLKRLGIVIHETDVKRRIADKGLQTHTTNLRKQSYAIATFELLLEQTRDAQGTLEREQENLTNQVKVLDAAFKSVVVVLKDQLVPVINSGVKFISKFVNKIVDIVESNRDLQQGLLFLRDAIKGYMVILGGLLVVLTSIAGVILTILGKIRLLTLRLKGVSEETLDVIEKNEEFEEGMRAVDDELEKLSKGTDRYSEDIDSLQRKQTEVNDTMREAAEKFAKLRDEVQRGIDEDEGK